MYYLNDDKSRDLRLKPQQELRSRNLKTLFDLIGSGEMTRTELTKSSGLSAAAVTKLTEDLISAGYVEEAGPGIRRSGGGRRPVPLRLRSSGALFPVFSIGDYGVDYKLFDLNRNILERIFTPCSKSESCSQTDGTADMGTLYADIIEEVLTVRSQELIQEKAPAVLVCYPGAYHEDLGLFIMTGFDATFPAESLCALENKLNLPFFIGNTSNALAYAEKKHLMRTGENAEDMIYINICSGVGSGIIRKDRPMPGKAVLSGEIGHMIIELNGRPCPCGAHGCLERYVSIGAICDEVRNAALKEAKKGAADSLNQLIDNLSLAAIAQAYKNGVASVEETLDIIAERLFAGIYSVVNVTGIRTVVIGGLNPLGDRFLDKLRSDITEKKTGLLMKHINIRFGDIPDDADSLGIADYYIDKVFAIR